MKNNIQKITVNDLDISIKSVNEADYFSLNDMVSNLPNGSKLIENWFNNLKTLDFLAVWEEAYNPLFNSPFLEVIKNSFNNNFNISINQWISKTNAIGIFAQRGKQGGTYAVKDIAYEFAMWVSPKFKLYLIKEYERLKKGELALTTPEWKNERYVNKFNYHIMTSAISQNLVVNNTLNSENIRKIYADEADLLNKIIFGFTAKEWRENNPQKVSKGLNARDEASVNQLYVMANLEFLNATLIKLKTPQNDRIKFLTDTANEQFSISNKRAISKSIKQLSK